MNNFPNGSDSNWGDRYRGHLTIKKQKQFIQMKASPLRSSDIKGKVTKGHKYKRLRYNKSVMD